MSRMILACLAALVVVMALVSGAGAFRLLRSVPPNATWPSEAMGFWQSDRNYTVCFNPNGAAVWGGLEAFDLARVAWNDAVGDYVSFGRGVNCAGQVPTQADLDSRKCSDNDGQSELVFVNYPGSEAGCFGIDTADLARGEVTAGDLIMNIGADGIGSGLEQYTWFEIALHELGHAAGLNHIDETDAGVPVYPCPAKSTQCVEIANQTNNCLAQNTCDEPTLDDIAGVLFVYNDADGDGCTDAEEANTHGSDPAAIGGLRNPNDQRDFADYDGDRVVTVLDLSAIGSWMLSAVPPAPSRFDADYDGAITILDVSAAGSQFGDSCLGGP